MPDIQLQIHFLLPFRAAPQLVTLMDKQNKRFSSELSKQCTPFAASSFVVARECALPIQLYTDLHGHFCAQDQDIYSQYYESLPDRREIALVCDELGGDIEKALGKAFRGRLFCAGSATRAFQISVQNMIQVQSGRDLHFERRERREQVQRDAAAKKAEEERKSVPKQERARERKRGRDIREQVRIELQSMRDIAVGAALAGLGVLGARCLGKASRTMDDISALLDGIKSIGRQLRGLLKHLWFVPLVLVLRYYVGFWRSGLLTAAIVAFLPKFLGSGLWAHVSEFFQQETIELQSGPLDVFSKLMSVAFTFSVFKGKVTATKVSEFCKRLSNIQRLSEGWESFLTWTMTALESLVNFVRERFGVERVKLFKRANEEALIWIKQVDKFLAENFTGREFTPELCDQVMHMVQIGYGLKECYRGTLVVRDISSALAKVESALEPHLGSVTARNNFRFEPVSTFLYGKPGVGKTIMSVPFVAALLMQSDLVPKPCTSSEVAREMWQKGTSEFWQGYNGQKAMIMDDVFQNRTFSGDKDNDYFNIIKMVGSFSMPLNFADLASKGRIYFSSKIIFGSTNLSSISSDARVVIQEPEAVARRINFGYELFVHDEWTTDGKLDYRLFKDEWNRCVADFVPGDDPLRTFPWHIWYVQNHDFVTGRTVGERMPLRDAIVNIAGEIKQRSISHEVTRNNLDAMIGAFSVQLQSGRTSWGSEFDTPDLSEDSFSSDNAVKRFVDSLLEVNRQFAEDHKCVSRMLKLSVFAAGTYIAFKIVRTILGALGSLLSGVFGRKPKVKTQSNRPLTKPKEVRQQVLLQNGGSKVVMDNIYANTYKMYVERTKHVFGQICFVAGEVAVQPQHFTEHLIEGIKSNAHNNDDVVVLRSSVNAEHSVRFTVGQYLAFERITDRDMDVEFVKFESIRAHRQVLNSFVTEKDLRYISGNTGLMHMCDIDDRKQLLMTVARNTWRLPSINYVNRPLVFGGRRMNRYIQYAGSTTPGDCGAPITLERPDAYGGRCWLGVHCAAMIGANVSYCNVVTREMVDDAIKRFSVIHDAFEEDLFDRGIKLQCGDSFPFEHMGSFLPLGVVDKPVSLCPKSKYFKTDLYGTLGEYTYQPAPLGPVVRNWERVWPMENAVRPYSSPLLHLDLPLLQDAVHTAFRPFVERTRDVRKGLYDFEEAVLGVPQDKFRSIPRNTSPGFPYIYEVKGGKKEFFGEDQDYDLSGNRVKELRARVDYILAQARKGVRLSNVYVDFLKDELRPAAKIEAVATRLISSAPLDYVVAWRMLFGTFSSAMMRINVDTGMAPGICSYSDWPRVAKHLQQHGTAVFDGDFKAFDSSEQPVVHNAILDHINLWYNDSAENQLARRVLWLDLVHSRHIGGRGDNQKYVYQWNHSLPSGHPFTTIVNSLYSLVSLVYSYFDLTGDRRGFWSHVAPLTYGDDNVCNVDDEKVGQFNQITVSDSMKRNFGMVYTSGHKDKELEPYTTLEEITFLKRGFFCDGDRWLCPLELESFLYTHYWCKNKKLEKQICVDVLENSLEELALHPPKLWPVYGRKLADLLREKFGRETNCCPTRQSYLSLVLSRTEDWY